MSFRNAPICNKQSLLTALFATAPATLLSFYAAIGVIFGFYGLWFAPALGLLWLAWGLAGIFGTVSLWMVTIGHWKPWVTVGLAMGIIAFVPILGLYLPILTEDSMHPLIRAGLAVWGFGLPLVSGYWLFICIGRSRRHEKEASRNAVPWPDTEKGSES